MIPFEILYALQRPVFWPPVSAHANAVLIDSSEIEIGSPPLKPASGDFELVIQSGGFYLEAVSDLGAYAFSDCTGTDEVCNFGYSTSLDYTISAGDSDYVEVPPRGIAGECICTQSDPLIISPRILLTQDNSVAEFVFDPGTSGDCLDGFNCASRRSSATTRCYSDLVLQVHDVSSTFTGKVRIFAQIFVAGIDQIADSCDDSSSGIVVSVKGKYNSPLSTATFSDLCQSNTHSIAAFNGSTISRTASESVGFSSVLTSAIEVTPSGGICQNQNFSIGFEFKTQGQGLHNYGGAMEIILTFLDGDSCP